eukprot:3266001-Rhodomonas_salina.1
MEGVLGEVETLAGYVQLHAGRLSHAEPLLLEVSALFGLERLSRLAGCVQLHAGTLSDAERHTDTDRH